MRKFLCVALVLCGLVGGPPEARAEEPCVDRLETTPLGGSCLTGWFLCGQSSGTSLTVPTKFGTLPITLSGSNGKFCCREFAVWPEHTRVLDGGTRIARVVQAIQGSLILRDCTGERRFLVFTWGKDACRMIKAVPLGTYLIHHLDPCEDDQD